MSRSRRRYEPDWPANLGARRKRLNRWFLVAALGLAVTVFATARPKDADAPVVATATPGTTATVAGTPGPVVLERRSDGWYLPTAEDWPLVGVEHIVDGDTLDVRASGVALRVRVFGIDTPERGEACYTEATKRLEALVGREIRLVPDRRLQDRSGRELRYVFTPAGRSVDATLLDEGYARAWRDDGALRDVLVGIEDGARAAKRGCLWSGASASPTPR